MIPIDCKKIDQQKTFPAIWIIAKKAYLFHQTICGDRDMQLGNSYHLLLGPNTCIQVKLFDHTKK